MNQKILQGGFVGQNLALRFFLVQAFLLLSLAAMAQTVSLSPTSLNFGNIVVGSTSAVKNVTLTNTGSATLSITSIVASPGFAEINNCGNSVLAGRKCVISVTFAPTAMGTATGSVTINNNASNSPQTVTLSGAGVATVSLSPTTLTFPIRTVGTTSTALPVTLSNNQTTALSITSVTVTGDFAETNTCGSSVAAGSRCTINTTFTPTVVGTRTGTLTITDSGSNSPQTVSLSGTGSTVGLVSIAITPANPSVLAGTTEQFHATGTFSGGNTYDLTQSVTWGSTKTTVATVSNASGTQGLATALIAGTATIRCSSGKIVGSTLLTVTAATTLQAIAVTPATPSIALGTTQQFTATGNYSDGSTQNLTNTAAWSSSATSVSTISTAGLATSVTVGTTTISATSGSIVGSTALTVTSATLRSIAVTPANATASAGTNEQYKALGTYSDGSTLDLTTTATWSSSATAIASISNAAGTQGLATTASAGTTTISAASGSVSGSAVLTVTAATLSSLAVTPANSSVTPGATQQYAATGTYSDSSTQNLTSSVTWSSSATSVATISNASGSQGVATGVTAGSTIISATLSAITGTASLAVANSPCSGPCVLTYHYDLARDGVAGAEQTLTPSNVNSSTFGRVGAITGVNGQIYGQPLYMSGLNSVSSQGNVVFLTTQRDYVYAFDADSLRQIWGASYIPASESPLTTGTGGDTTCTNITPNIGITGTPVIDPNTTFNPNPVMYFVTKSVDGNKKYHQRLHAVDVVTGVEVFGGPVEITTPVSSPEVFDPLLENQHAGLVLTYDANQNPQIYIAWGAHCDIKEYHGWVMKFVVTSGLLTSAPSAYFLTTHGVGAEGGIWMGGGAPAVDSSTNGNLYLVTGDGNYDGIANFGNSVLKLDSNLDVADWYTPNDWNCLNGITGNSNCQSNRDLGSAGLVLFNVASGVPELVTAGKKGEIYVMYQSNLGHLDPLAPPPNYAPPETCTSGPPLPTGGPNNIAQCFPGIVTTAANAGGSRSSPAFWNNTLYIAGSNDALRAFPLDTTNIGTFNATSAVASFPATYPYPGTPGVISWNGSDPNTAVLWTLQTGKYAPPATSIFLWAYTAVPNGSTLTSLYQSPVGPGSIKFQVPTVANGKVFVAGQGFDATGTEGQLYVYGLCPCN